MDEPTNDAATDALPADERMLLAYLAERDVACPSCTYNLRGLTTPRCPECGRELKLSVGLAEPYLRAWVSLAFAVFGATGIGLLFWVVFLRDSWPRHFLGWVCFVYFTGNLPIAIAIAVGRRRFMRVAARVQWLVAVAWASATLAALFLFAATIN